MLIFNIIMCNTLRLVVQKASSRTVKLKTVKCLSNISLSWETDLARVPAI